MNYTLLPSLEKMTLIKIAITLWNQNDIKAIILENSVLNEDSDLLPKLEDVVLKKLLHVPISEPLKEKVAGLIKPIGKQILGWIDYNRFECGLGKIVPNAFHWTPQGTIAHKNTAKALLKDKTLDHKKSYILACAYCLEEEISNLWNHLSKKDKKQLKQCYWTDCLLNPSVICNKTYIYQFAFKKAIECYNEEATKYFFQKVSPEERNECLVELIENLVDEWSPSCPGILHFLLSQLNEVQEAEVILNCSRNVLIKFLKWPLQTLFVEMANRVNLFCTEYYEIVKEIVNVAIAGYKDYDYQNLLGEFWQLIPKSDKRFILQREITTLPVLLSKLLKIKYLENFYLILDEATPEEFKEIFSFEGIRHSLDSPLLYDNFFSLPLILQVFVSSSSINKVQFMNEFRKRVMCSRPKQEIEMKKDTWNMLFCKFIRVLNNKRIIEEYENCPVVKLPRPIRRQDR